MAFSVLHIFSCKFLAIFIFKVQIPKKSFFLFSNDLFNVYNIFWLWTVFFYLRCSCPSEIFIPKAYLFFGIVHKNFSEFSTKRVQIPFCPKNPLKISTVSYSAFLQKNCPQTAYLSHLRAKYLFSKGKMVTRTGIESNLL